MPRTRSWHGVGPGAGSLPRARRLALLRGQAQHPVVGSGAPGLRVGGVSSWPSSGQRTGPVRGEALEEPSSSPPYSLVRASSWPEGSAVNNPLKTPTPAEIEAAVAFIRQSAARQMELGHAIMDGAILAAEQVQDKRLGLLEQGPEVSGWDILLDFAMVFVLESPLAGKILQAVTVKALAPRIRANPLAQANALPVAALPRGARVPARSLSVPACGSAPQLRRDIEALRAFERRLFQTGHDQGPYPYAVAFLKAVRETAGQETRPAPVLVPSDTP